MFDFENLAKQILSPEAWAYYSSGGDDEITLRENHAAFHRIWFKPRVLVNVSQVDTTVSMFGTSVGLPVYITATALGRLGHPEGEVILTKAAGTRNIIQMMPTLASCSVDEMVSARMPTQTQWFQLYVNADRNLTKNIVLDVIRKGVKGICVTVDAPQLGRREKDMRLKFEDDAPDIRNEDEINRSSGAARAISSFIDPSLEWKDITWLKSFTSVPLVIKGIQCGEDAILAAKSGVSGIIISNHGGRQLDTCRSAIEILEEVVDDLAQAGLQGKLELYIDGGIRRGADIFKAIALGAKGVGVGRPFLYAMSCYGQQGVERAIDILKEELEMVMRLAGCPKISDITRQHIITKDLANHAYSRDYLSDSVYEKMVPLSLAKI
jgi:L-lactate dehydrogenase (cytochrome)